MAVLIGALFAAGCGGGHSHASLVPGRSIGHVRLLETRQAVEAKLGSPDHVSVVPYPVGPPEVRAEYDHAALGVAYGGTGSHAKVAMIWTRDKRYVSANGLEVGAPMVDGEHLLSGAQCSHTGTTCQLQSAPRQFTIVEGRRGGDVTQIDILVGLPG